MTLVDVPAWLEVVPQSFVRPSCVELHANLASTHHHQKLCLNASFQAAEDEVDEVALTVYMDIREHR